MKLCINCTHFRAAGEACTLTEILSEPSLVDGKRHVERPAYKAAHRRYSPTANECGTEGRYYEDKGFRP